MVSIASRTFEILALALTFVASVSFLPTVSASSNVATHKLDADLRSEAILAVRAALPSSHPLPEADLKYQNNNLALLPAQICGIVGAYLFTVVVLGVCLLTFGRRMRRDAQHGSAQVEVEMVKSPQQQYDPSPMSPASTSKRWMRRGVHKDRKSAASTVVETSAPVSPGAPGYEHFDAKVVADNREQQQRDLEMLYQAVMEQDERKASMVNRASGTVDDERIGEQQKGSISSMSPQSGRAVDRRILRVQTGRDAPMPSDLNAGNYPDSPTNPRSPRSPIKAIYPPGEPTNYNPMYARRRPSIPGQQPPASPRSFASSGGESVVSANTLASKKLSKKNRKAARDLRISAPIGQVDYDSERTPLSAGFYDNPGPAPQPPTLHNRKSVASVTSARTFITSDSDEEEQYVRMQREAVDQPAPLPRPAPQRGNAHPLNIDTRSLRSNHSIHSSSATTLPFRNLHPDAAVPPTPVRTTVLESKAKLAMRGQHTAPLSAVPYSPYMPYTPITPVTPHLMNRREMQARKKDERRRVMAKDDGDLVEDDREMWGDAY